MTGFIVRPTLIASALFATSVGAQDARIRMVIATDVACRVRPDTSAPVMTRLRMGDRFLPRDETRGTAGSWFLDDAHVNLSQRGSNRGCWIFGPLTALAADAHAALLAAVDRSLANPDETPFESFVAVDNLLRTTKAEPHGDSAILSRSPILQLRRLQVLARATGAPATDRTSVVRNPLKHAWFLGYGNMLFYYEPAGGWFVRPDEFWSLYERHRDTEWAEQLAWGAARAAVPSDECDAPCVLQRLTTTYMRYWAAFPNGRWVREAVTIAVRDVTYAAEIGCMFGAGDVRSLTNMIRTSLAGVNVPGREAFLVNLETTERKCRGFPTL